MSGMEQTLDNLNCFEIKIKLVDQEVQLIADFVVTEIDKETLEKRMGRHDKIESYDIDVVNWRDIDPPVFLLGINSRYNTWEDLYRDYMIFKLSGA